MGRFAQECQTWRFAQEHQIGLYSENAGNVVIGSMFGHFKKLCFVKV